MSPEHHPGFPSLQMDHTPKATQHCPVNSPNSASVAPSGHVAPSRLVLRWDAHQAQALQSPGGTWRAPLWREGLL